MYRTESRYHLSLAIVLGCCLLVLLSATPLSAKVRGRCSNCHTVTKRIDLTTEPKTGGLTGGGAQGSTVGDCLSCHSSPGAEAVRFIGECRVPIVFNLERPNKPLAAGKFY